MNSTNNMDKALLFSRRLDFIKRQTLHRIAKYQAAIVFLSFIIALLLFR